MARLLPLTASEIIQFRVSVSINFKVIVNGDRRVINTGIISAAIYVDCI